jgi:thermitase
MTTTTNITKIAVAIATIIIAAVAFFPTTAHAQDTVTYLVQFAANSTDAERAAWMAANGATLVDWMPQIAVAKIERNPNFVSASSDMSAVSFIENDVTVTGEHVVSDAAFNDSQMGYGQNVTNVKAAWNVTTGSASTIVAVVDTGINSNHTEFAGRLVAGYDFVNNDNDPSDDHGHGTHVAGIIAAGLNGQGTVGMCPDCSIMAVKVLNNKNAGTWSTVAKGILFAVDNGAKVINLSLGAAVSSATLESAVAYAHSKNVVVVAAAGNSNSAVPFYPAAIESVIAVAASDSNDGRWMMSNYGAHIDVAAPGSMIYSTYNNGDYATMSGTSMAAPFVSGLAALVISRNPALTADEVSALISNNATDLGDAGKDVYFGNGRIDAYQTLVAANGNVEPEADASTTAPVVEPVTETTPVTSPVENTNDTTNSLYLALVTVAN